MAAFIADASAVAALLLEELSAEQGTWVAMLGDEGALAPAHFPIEVTSALVAAMFSNRIGQQVQIRRLAEAAQLPIRIEPPADWSTLERISALAATQHKLSVYDAIYLDLALRTGLPLATYDKALIAAARRSGIEVLS